MNHTHRGTAANAIVIALIAIAALFLIGVVYGFTASNAEIRLRNTIEAKQVDNQSELDNLQKKISQVAQINKAQWKAIQDIVVGNSDARTKGSGSLATLVHEAVPSTAQIDSRQFVNLVASSRDSFTQRQKEILDLNREHNNCLDVAPSSWICGNRPRIKVIVVTSDRAEDNFRTGRDNDIDVFNTPKLQ